jgi:hypothetical protein
MSEPYSLDNKVLRHLKENHGLAACRVQPVYDMASEKSGYRITVGEAEEVVLGVITYEKLDEAAVRIKQRNGQ